VNGDLVLTMRGREVRHKRPVAFQETNGVRKEVAARYVLRGKHRAGIRLGSYDSRRRLVIDPELLYATYFGSSCQANGIALDSAGNIYLAGSAWSTGFPWSTDFPVSASAFQKELQNPANSERPRDVIVTKLNAAGNAIVYSTFLGGRGEDVASAIAVDKEGNVCVAGWTGWNDSNDFPTTPGAHKRSVDPCTAQFGCGDGFVAKLNPTGSALVYSTYVGGSGSEAASDMAIDPAGSAYIIGQTSSTDLPVSNGAFQTSLKGGRDLFVTKFDPAGALVYSTYLGGSGEWDGPGYDQFVGLAIAVNGEGNAFVTGYTDSRDFPVTPGAFQTTPRTVVTDDRPGGVFYGHAFVTKLNPAGTGLEYSTFLGGSHGDGGSAIAVDSAGNAYVAGATSSYDFPAANPFQAGNSSVPLTKSNDGGLNWRALSIPSPSTGSLSFAPNDSRKLFVASDRKLFVSHDSGQNWTVTGLSGPRIYRLEFDPVNPNNVYARTYAYTNGNVGVLYKSTDGGINWTPSLSGAFFTGIVVDSSSPSTVYASASSFTRDSPNGVFKSTDGGLSWRNLNNGLSHDELQVYALAVDPLNSAVIYIGTLKGVFKSTDGGKSWAKTPITRSVLCLEMDLTSPATLYASTDEFEENVALNFDDPGGRVNPRRRFVGSAPNQSGIFKSSDGAASWQPIGTGLHPDPYVTAIRIDRRAPSTLYILEDRGVFKSDKAGESWARLNPAIYGAIEVLEVSPHDSSVYIGLSAESVPPYEAFVAKLNPSGSSLIYSSYLGGLRYDGATNLAVDAEGNAYVIGNTDSPEFHTTPNALDRTFGGSDLIYDVFVAKVSPIGQLLYSSYLGGSFFDLAGGIAIRADGTVIICGSTSSNDFPVVKPYQSSLLGKADPYKHNAFVVALSIPSAAPVVGPIVHGASVSGKKLFVRGENFGAGAVILLDGKEQVTLNDAQNPTSSLMSKKAGKLAKPGRELSIQVRNPDGFVSNPYPFTRR
jgi:photosystem II stability/assembly factor-like uncharacterized protein